MGLLHSKTQEAARALLWELVELGAQAGLPLPPAVADLQLPQVLNTALVGDLAGAAQLLGGNVVEQLRQELGLPDVRGLLTGNLGGAQAALQGYLGGIGVQKSALLNEVNEALGTVGALGVAQARLSGLRSLLDDVGRGFGLDMAALGGVLPAWVVDTVREASPELATLLGHARSALASVDSRLAGAQDWLAGLQRQVLRLTDLQGLAAAGLDLLRAQAEQLDELLELVGV